MTPDKVSLRPSDAVEGGAVPVDKNLVIIGSRFSLWDYMGKAKNTTAAKIDFKDDDGTEYTQYYSVGDPERFAPSEDGKTLVAVGTAAALSKSSNFVLFMTALVNAGFPENKVGEDISSLEGLKAYYIGQKPPTRAGLAQNAPVEGQKVYEKVILVPSVIIKLPWEKTDRKMAGTAGKALPKAEAETAEESSDETAEDDVTTAAVDFIGKVVKAEGGSTTRQKVAQAVFKDKELAKNGTRDGIASAVFAPGTQAALVAAGFTVKGETISK